MHVILLAANVSLMRRPVWSSTAEKRPIDGQFLELWYESLYMSHRYQALTAQEVARKSASPKNHNRLGFLRLVVATLGIRDDNSGDIIEWH